MECRVIDEALNLLIVEDSDSDLELILREIKNGGFKFTYRHCQTEEKFNDYLYSFEPDLILSDHNLPSFNSINALNAARKFNPCIPFILVSKLIGEDEAIDLIVNQGVDDFILKDNLLRLNPAILREFKNYRLKTELEQKTNRLKRLSLVANHTHSGVVITNEKYKIEWVNEAYTILTGYNLNDCYGQDPGSFLRGLNTNPETVARVSNKIKEKIPFKEEILNYHKNGTPYWIKLDVTPIIDGLGELTHYIEIQEDITDQKEFEHKLIEANERLLEAQELAKIGDWSMDFVTQETYISPMVKKIHDVDPEFEFDIEKGLLFFKEGYDRDRKREVVEKALNDGTPYNEELKLITASGKEKWVRSIGEAIIKNGKCVRLYGTIMDITEEKNLRDSLEENQQRLDVAITGANLGIWDANIKEGTTITNKRWSEMFGFSSEEIEDPYSFFFSAIHPDDGKKILSEIAEIEKGKKKSFEEIVRVKSKSGKYRTILDKGTAMEYDSDGKAKRLIGTHLDITDQYTLQKKLEKSLNEKTILLSEIHHRVKNNLAIVSGLLDLQAFDTNNDIVKDALFNMGQRIKSIAGVHELLYQGETYSEVKLGMYINKLIKNINSSLFNDKNVQFKISIDKSVIVNINQAVPIGLLLNELITNSLKYAFRNINSAKIGFEIKQNGSNYSAEYNDNGPGIDLEEIENPTSLGITLINTLLSQLDADFSFNNSNGFKLTFNFEEQKTGAHSNLRE